MHDKHALDGREVCGCHASPLAAVKTNVDHGVRLPVFQTPDRLSIGTLDNYSSSILPKLSGTLSHGSDSEAYKTIPCSLCNLNVTRTAVDRTSPQSRNLVKHSQDKVSDDGSKGMTIPPRSNEEPVVTITLPWHSATMAFFTMYGELRTALTPEEFALVRARLHKEWTFDGGVVS